MKKERDFALDILRTLACIMVMGVHLGQHISIPGALGAFFEKGSTGVGFFFILSGYLAYCSLEKDNNTYSFWIKRAIHVLPLYYLAIVFYFVFYSALNAVPKDPTGLYWIRYIFMINRWIPTEIEFWSNLGAVWSISVFAFFYFIAPLYYRKVKNYYSAWAGTIVMFAVLKLFDHFNYGIAPLRHMFYFSLGILIYLAVKDEQELSIVIILSTVLLFCLLTGKGEMIGSPLLASLYIVATRKRQVNLSQNNIIYKAVSNISIISYSLYLDHVIVVNVLDYMRITDTIAYLLCFLFGSLSLAYVTYKLVEVRLSGRLQEFLLRNEQNKH